MSAGQYRLPHHIDTGAIVFDVYAVSDLDHQSAQHSQRKRRLRRSSPRRQMSAEARAAAHAALRAATVARGC